MLELKAHAARFYLRLLEHLRDVVDRAVGHAGCLEQLEPLALAALSEYLAEQARQLHAVLDALAVGGESGVARELGAARGFAKFPIEVVVAAGEDHIPIGGTERLVRH